LFFQGTHEFGVGEAFFVEGGVQANIPESTHVAFFVAAVSEGISACVHDGFISRPLFFGTRKPITLHLFKNVSSRL